MRDVTKVVTLKWYCWLVWVESLWLHHNSGRLLPERGKFAVLAVCCE